MKNQIIHLYLIRHGKTISKNENMIFGQRDIDVSKEGKKQIAEIAKSINGRVEVIFSSPLKRAVESAQILSLGKIPIIVKEELKEMSFGDYTEQDISKHPSVFIDKYKSYLHPSKKFPNGESVNDLKKRIEKFHKWLLEQNYSSICVVSHQWVLNTYLKSILESDFEKGANFIFQTGKVTHVKLTDKNEKFLAHNINYFDTYK